MTIQEPVEGDSNTCYICGKPKEEWLPRPVPLESEPMAHLGVPCWSMCSEECDKKWHRGNSMHLSLGRIKHVLNLEFEQFNEIFGFGLDGGYAQKKFELMRLSPLQFLFTLDKKNVYKIAQIKR